MTKSKIEWTDATWNPIRGCVKISPGCKHCYAQAFAERFRNVAGHPYEQGFDLRLVPHKLDEPLRWSTHRIVFANSMSDLFQDAVPDEYIELVCRIMVAARWHTFQVLTKRANRMHEMLRDRLAFAAQAENIWWGVSVEDQKYGLPRLRSLSETPARTRFLSIEPLLEDLGPLSLAGIDWVIVGGESGRGARPMDESWVQAIRLQCEAVDVPFFFKQWGGVQKGRHGRLLNNRTYNAMPARRASKVPSLLERQSLVASFSSEIDRWLTAPQAFVRVADIV